MTSNDVAYLHAYKMLALFGPATGKNLFKHVTTFILLHNLSGLRTPLHDALIFPLPQQTGETPTTIHLPEWQAIIRESGFKALKIFQMAHKIEHHLGRAPHDFSEANDTKALLNYSRHKEYPELAELCGFYDLSETVFNQCLEIDKVRKSTDLIPDVFVDGSEVGHKGYYLVKLPINDPRAYILGHITNCCQSIGGHSEKCVIDGITRKSNGFYVLLKQKTINDEATPLVNKQINYKDFEIVGEGYAWLSKNGNLTFDSWENLREVENVVIVPLLKKFAEKVTEIYLDILRVTIGKGGGTPVDFQSGPTTTPEVMAEGKQYADSQKQVVVYLDEKKLKKMREDLLSKKSEIAAAWLGLEKVIEPMSDLFTSTKEFKLIEKVFLNTERFNWEKIVGEHRKQFDVSAITSLGAIFNIIQISNILQENGILTNKNFKLLIDNVNSAHIGDGVINALSLLQMMEMLNDANFESVITNVDHADRIAESLVILHEYRLCDVNATKILTSENIKLVIDNAKLADKITSAVSELRETGILTNENFKLVIDNATYANEIYNAVVELRKCGILTNENFKFVTAHAQYAHGIANSLYQLQKAGILTDEHRTLLASHEKHAFEIARVLDRIIYKNTITDENIKLVINNAQYAKEIEKALFQLHEARILTDENFKLLITHAEYANGIEFALSQLKKIKLTPCGFNIDLDEIFKLVIARAEYVYNIANALSLLQRNYVSINKNVLQLVIDNPKYAYDVSEALVALKSAGMLTDENLKLLGTHPQKTAKIISKLHDTRTLTDENFKLAVRDMEHASQYKYRGALFGQPRTDSSEKPPTFPQKVEIDTANKPIR